MSIIGRMKPQHRVFAGFAIYAFILGQLFTRLPTVKDAMGIGEGALGLGLIGAPVGTLIALTLAPPLIERFGHKRSMIAALCAMSVFYAIAVHATGPVALFLLLVPAGLTLGTVEIIINLEADRVEATLPYRIMNRAHAFWSLGFFGAGLFGALMAQIGLSPQLHLALVVPLSGAAIWLLLSDFSAAPKRGSEMTGPSSMVARPSLAIMALVGLCLSAMVLEGGSIDWSAIYMRTIFETAPYFGGLTVATVALSQALLRYFADPVVDRFQPVPVARGMQVAMAVGVVMVFFAPNAWVALAGFAMIGAGTSALFPLAMSAAAQRTDRPSSVNVAALAQFSFVAFLLGPPLLGFVAEHIGLRWVFGLTLPLILLSAALSKGLQPDTEKRAA
ncbi:MFS transporter [Loktanella sp. TSTF-M6]|uniref:MFS transporter n=1 Tax=Loktanella gaetbuli TaxID=2881335 RepID=A0ABS8BU27_9RHOB|nr:MFS transporter [Loktanella gaetbuli]MCB5199239.1 MFS transporter [Loktanella gaetbuli]